MPENIIYSDIIHMFPSQASESRLVKFTKKVQRVAKILAIVGFSLILISYGPSIFYFAQSGGRNVVSKFLALTVKDTSKDLPKARAASDYEPAFDPSLSKTNMITIPSIGVKTNLQEATYENYEDALRRGVWRVSDFGAPGEAKPVILAAHRYGYLAWTNQFRRENSFLNLPKLKVGDLVTIVWHQRKYTYEIYAEEKGKQISDYSANLILYTCVNLTGEERIFKYARLLEI